MFEFLEKYIKRNDIGEPPYSYDFLLNLKEVDYPKYLKKIFKSQTGKNLNLKHPKTFNEKIQWLKLYDCTPLKTRLTDKVLVRDWVKEKIGEEYLKPVLWIGKTFDEIPFAELPEQFIIKANHGCKWCAKVKKKSELLNNKKLYNFTKKKFNGWLKQTFFPYAGFELQYKNIQPFLLIEPLLGDNNFNSTFDIEIMCFNGIPRLYKVVNYDKEEILFDTNELNLNDIEFAKNDIQEYELIKKVSDLSLKLAKDFKLVRVDWFITKEKIYFGEMTFSPCSGFYQFYDESFDIKLGKILKI